MRSICLFLVFISAVHLFAAAGVQGGKEIHPITFTENKGQVSDQHQVARPDVLFSSFTGGFLIHFKTSGVSYQFSRPLKTQTDKQLIFSECYRLDVNWLGTSPDVRVNGTHSIAGTDNYYLDHCAEGVTGVRKFTGVHYTALYKGIDIKWYACKGELKYDYLVAAGADYRQIRLELKGATSINVNRDGGLVLQTPLGQIIEDAPVVIQQGKVLTARWSVKNNIVSFVIDGIDPAKPFVIDPIVREWGTYYGGPGNDAAVSMSRDAAGNIFFCGNTTSTGTTMATSGAHQVTYGGSNDVFVTGVNASGVRLWSTYYGAVNALEEATACEVDPFGDVYLFAYGFTSTVIATPGSHQPVSGGNYDAFLVKFNVNGVRQWATWYGAYGGESSGACTIDAAGNVYIAGQTSSSSSTVLATPNAFQTIGGCYLAKFNVAGVRQWGTYFGDDYIVNPQGLVANAAGDVFMGGATTSTGTGMTTNNAHQMFNGGGTDAFLCRFSTSGVLMWSTFYGGSGSDRIVACAMDPNGDLYIAGATSSSVSNVISTPGGFQPAYGGGGDAFLAKFDQAGVRQWATYYGGAMSDDATGCTIDPNGNIYICGSSQSTAGIVTPGAYQSTIAGNSDVFMALFSSSGARLWGSYYGDNNYEEAADCESNAPGTLYVCGVTMGGSNLGVLTSPGSMQPVIAGSSDCLLFKLVDCPSLPPAPSITTPSANLSFCPGGSATITASGTGTLSWYAVPTGSFPISVGNSFTTAPLSSGATWYVEDKVCGASVSRTPVTVTVLPLPVISASGPAGICVGGTATFTAAGGVCGIL